MKIGIITKHSVPNYGAMLQAYALATWLRSNGHDAEIVDYDQPTTTKYFRPSMFWVPPKINAWRRYLSCKRFVRKHQPRSKYHCTSVDTFLPHANDYDLLFTGSDQVWFTGPVQYYDPMYFLDFPVKKTRKASYAPSTGGIEDFGEYRGQVKYALSKFTHLSARDDNTERLLNDLGFYPTRVLDPTFLHDFHDLIDTENSPIPEPYLLIFGNLSKAAQTATQSKARELMLSRIVSLQYKNEIATDRLPAASPINWLNYYYHASYVVTTYFHGSVFAIKFRKPFVSIPTRGRIKKVRTLLKDTKLESQCVIEGNQESQQLDQAMKKEFDWSICDRCLNEKIEHSQSYIRSVIDPA